MNDHFSDSQHRPCLTATLTASVYRQGQPDEGADSLAIEDLARIEGCQPHEREWSILFTDGHIANAHSMCQQLSATGHGQQTDHGLHGFKKATWDHVRNHRRIASPYLKAIESGQAPTYNARPHPRAAPQGGPKGGGKGSGGGKGNGRGKGRSRGGGDGFFSKGKGRGRGNKRPSPTSPPAASGAKIPRTDSQV